MNTIHDESRASIARVSFAGRTQVAIIGAGPAGLLLSQLLYLAGVDSVVLESRSRAEVEATLRAGVLEQSTIDLLIEAGVGERMLREGALHHGIELRFAGRGYRIPLSELTDGRAIMLYAQHEVIKDLIAARVAAGGRLLFDVRNVAPAEFDSAKPVVRFQHDNRNRELHCD